MFGLLSVLAAHDEGYTWRPPRYLPGGVETELLGSTFASFQIPLFFVTSDVFRYTSRRRRIYVYHYEFGSEASCVSEARSVVNAVGIRSLVDDGRSIDFDSDEIPVFERHNLINMTRRQSQCYLKSTEEFLTPPRTPSLCSISIAHIRHCSEKSGIAVHPIMSSSP